MYRRWVRVEEEMSTYEKFVHPLSWEFQERYAWVEYLRDFYGALLQEFSGKMLLWMCCVWICAKRFFVRAHKCCPINLFDSHSVHQHTLRPQYAHPLNIRALWQVKLNSSLTAHKSYCPMILLLRYRFIKSWHHVKIILWNWENW